MSLQSKVTLAGAFLLSGGIIGYVHYKQRYDRDRLHQGVLRDVERQNMRKTENIYELQRQKELTKILQEQTRQATKEPT